MSGITVERVTAPTPELAALVGTLEAGLAATYPPEQRHGVPLHALFEPHIGVFLARRDGVAVGCGAVALLGHTAEVKRMFVAGASRCTGVARRLLERIEAEARGAGATWLRLETGDGQHAALTVYERTGFRRCGAFGSYASMPAAALASSVFFEKALVTEPS